MSRLCQECGGINPGAGRICSPCYKERLKLKRPAYAAVQRVKYAVKRGELADLKMDYVKCTDCDNRATVYDHADYRKPLEVEPVCRSCNIQRGPALPFSETMNHYGSFPMRRLSTVPEGVKVARISLNKAPK